MKPLSPLPPVICLCPTYGRPQHLIANTIACFQAQTYPNKRLLICDDLGNIAYRNTIPNVLLMQTDQRYRSLPEKYNHMLSQVSVTDGIVVVWEDDDLYLPHHIVSCVDALQGHAWAHPQRVWSTYTGKPEIEEAGGRFHASLAFRSEFLNQIGGWPDTDSPAFDQMLIFLASQNALCGPPNPDPSDYPSYCFRWLDTQSLHGQSTMKSGDQWYRDYRPQYTQTVWVTPQSVRHDDAAVETLCQIEMRLRSPSHSLSGAVV